MTIFFVVVLLTFSLCPRLIQSGGKKPCAFNLWLLLQQEKRYLCNIGKDYVVFVW